MGFGISELNLEQIDVNGRIKVVDMQVDSIIPTIMRHIIKRYLKKVGLLNVKVEHKLGDSPFVMRLIVTGVPKQSLRKEDEFKLNYLNQSLDEVQRSAPSVGRKAAEMDPEKLRILLSRQEPAMKKIYYKVH